MPQTPIFISTETSQLEMTPVLNGGWTLSSFLWEGHELVGDGSTLFAAGWEFTLNGVRHTPHTQNTEALACRRDGERWIFPNRIQSSVIVEHILCWSHGGLEQSLKIRNDTDEAQTLHTLNYAQVKFSPAFLKDAEILSQYGTTPTPVTQGQFDLHDPVLFFNKTVEDWGLALIHLSPGQMRSFITGEYTSWGYSNGKLRFEEVLPPGESFTSEPAVILPYAGSPVPALSDWIRSRLRKGEPFLPEATYCSWEPFGRDIDQSKILGQLQRASDLGFKTFVIDDGWQDASGDWNPDPEKFPQGLEPLVEAAEKAGMGLGLWLSIATLASTASYADAFADCLVVDPQGRPRSTQVFEGKMELCCLASRFGDYIYTVLDRLVSDYRLRYLKLDLPVANDVYFKPAIQCHAQHHQHPPGEGYSLRSYRAVMNLSRKLKAKYPDLVVDLTFELWGGWHMMDPALLECADCSWLSNLRDVPGQHAPREARHLAASRAKVIPPAHQVVGNLRCSGPEPVESVVSSLASYPMLLGDLSEVSQQNADQIKQVLTGYENLRNRVDFRYASFSFADTCRPYAPDEPSGFYRHDKNGSGFMGVFWNQSKEKALRLNFSCPEGHEMEVVEWPGVSLRGISFEVLSSHGVHIQAERESEKIRWVLVEVRCRS